MIKRIWIWWNNSKGTFLIIYKNGKHTILNICKVKVYHKQVKYNVYLIQLWINSVTLISTFIDHFLFISYFNHYLFHNAIKFYISIENKLHMFFNIIEQNLWIKNKRITIFINKNIREFIVKIYQKNYLF